MILRLSGSVFRRPSYSRINRSVTSSALTTRFSCSSDFASSLFFKYRGKKLRRLHRAVTAFVQRFARGQILQTPGSGRDHSAPHASVRATPFRRSVASPPFSGHRAGKFNRQSLVLGRIFSPAFPARGSPSAAVPTFPPPDNQPMRRGIIRVAVQTCSARRARWRDWCAGRFVPWQSAARSRRHSTSS